MIAEQAPLPPAVQIEAPGAQLDLEVVTKALEAMSGEIVLEKVIQALMRIAVEHSAIGYVTPADRLAGRHLQIFSERDRKLELARQNRQTKQISIGWFGEKAIVNTTIE